MTNRENSEALAAFIYKLAQHGRTDCYSAFNTRKGKGYLLCEEAVSEMAITAHLRGEQPVAIYLFDSEKTRLAALDIDNHGGELDWNAVAARTKPLIADLAARGITPLVVRSGGGSGIHIWLVWREPQKARDVRHFLKRLLRKHGLKPGTAGLAEGGVEIYPKQDNVPERRLGNPIALPFSRRSLPLDSDLHPVSLASYSPPDIERLYAPDIDSLPTNDLPDDAPKPKRASSPPDTGMLQGDEVEARAALRHVPADNYDDWIRVGFILKRCFGDAGFALWEEWSRTSAKYPGEDECRESWDSFEPDGSLGIGTLFHMAQQHGWNGPSDPEIREMNAKYGIVTQGTKTMIVEKRIDPEEDSPFIWTSKEVLRDRYRSRKVLLPNGTGGKNEMPLADYWLGNGKADHYRRIDFNPEMPPGGNGNTYNIWTGFAVSPAPGDWSRLQDHIAHNICREDPELNEWLLNWLALGVQQPGSVIGTAPVLSGLPGVGKGVLAHAYGSLWGRHYTTITQESHVSGRFNAHLFGRRFIFIDEGMWGGNRQDAGTIKTRITEPYLMLEAKGIDPIRIRNRTIYMISSNEASIVPADIADRRWQIFEVGDRNREDHAYFRALSHQLDEGGREAMLHDLLNRDVAKGPDPRRTIKTAGLFEQILRAQGAEFRYVFQILDDGVLPQPDAPGNGPGVTTIGAMHAQLRASQPNGGFVQPRNLGRYLHGIFDDVKTVQSGTFIEGHGTQAIHLRSTRYHFPPLAQCRRDFERFIGQAVPWSNDLDEWQGGEPSGFENDDHPF